MVVPVAGKTGRIESQVGRLLLLQLRIRNIGRLVAVPAFLASVFAAQLEPGFRMVEARIIETDQLEFPAVVVAVALYAFPAGDLAGCMVTFLFPYPPRKRFVAFQAFVPGNLFPQQVALCAVRQALEIRMGLGELSRRKLGSDRICNPQDEQAGREGPED